MRLHDIRRSEPPMPSNGARSGSWTEATTGDPVIPICPSSPRAHRWGERPMTPGPRFRCRRHSSDIKEVAAQSWQCAIPRDKNAMVSVRHLIGAAVELWRQQRAAGLPSALRRQGQSRPNPRGALAACLESFPIDLNVALKFQSSPIACQSVTLLRDSSTMRRGGCRWFPKWSEDRLGLTALAAGARLDGSDTRDQDKSWNRCSAGDFLTIDPL